MDTIQSTKKPHPISDTENQLVSLIVPCFNEEQALPIFYSTVLPLIDNISDYNFELLFVDDGSSDKTLTILQDLTQKDARIGYLSFSRNFGKEAAMLAGLEKSHGDFVVMMDADLQDPPALIPKMLNYLEHNPNVDSVGTRRVSREGEPPIRSLCARLFYRLINRMTDVEMVDGARDFRLMRRDMVNAILSCPEYNRYSKGIWSFVGFKTKWFEYENVKRSAGETHWSFWKLVSYAIDAIVDFSTIPLLLAAFLGMLFCLCAFVVVFIIILRTLILGDPVPGWPSLACIIVFVSGIQLLFLGIVGVYLSKTYLETKRRPHFVIKDSRTPKGNRHISKQEKKLKENSLSKD